MVAEGYRDYMYGFIRNALTEIGPRESCSENEKKLARLLAEEWKASCDGAALERFTCSPTAFLGFLPFAVVLYLAAAVFYWILPPLSLLFAAAGASMLFFEMVRYREFVDFLFPKKEGENVVGTVRPRGEVKRRVVVSAHLDSAYEFNLWYLLKGAAIPVMIAASAGVVLMLGAAAAETAAWFAGTADMPIYRALGAACMALFPLFGLFFFFHTYKPVPGAMDDLSGVSVVAGLARYLQDARKGGSFFPEHTEVVLFGAAAEEAGLRGAKWYVTAHGKEMKKLPTFGLFLDGIYDEKFLTVVSRELFTGAKHDPGLVRTALSAAADRGWRMKKKMVLLGGTDAAAFSREGGIPSTCILCQDISRLVPNYHTRNDTIEHIRPESLSVTLQLVVDIIERIDKEQIE
ncbi:MAG: M28 family peptidase [bacterium]